MLRHVPIWPLLALTATFQASCTSANSAFPGLSYLPPRPDNTLLEASGSPSGRPSVPSVPDLPPPPPPPPSSPFPPPPSPPSVFIPFPEDNPGFQTAPGSGVIPFPPVLDSLGVTLGAPVDPFPPHPVGSSGCNEACTKIYSPVCGTDGVTYSNKCLLNVAACKGLATGLNIEVAFEGTCEGSFLESVDVRGSSLPAEFDSSSSSSLCDKQCTKIFNPVCGTDHNSYNSPCLLETASCEAVNSGGTLITIAYEGQCVVRDTAFFAAVMTPSVIAAPLVSVTSSVVTSDGFDNIGTTTLSSEIACPEACTKIFKPVCGTDDQTYNNECILNVAACRSRSAGADVVFKAFDGPCVAALPRGPVCDHACDKTFLPVCGSDGESYNNICLLNLADCLNPFATITHAGDGPCSPKAAPSLSSDRRPSVSIIPAQNPIPNHSQATERGYIPPV